MCKSETMSRTKHKTIARLLLATFLIPHAAIGAITPRAVPDRVAISAEVLAGLWGGVSPAAHIGGDYEYGMLTVLKATGLTCPGDYIGTAVAPQKAGACNQSVPFFIQGEDVRLVLGGNAANLSGGYTPPAFTVYVNGVAVPESQLGPDFQHACPQLASPWGTATVNGVALNLYSCSGSTNEAVVSHSLLRAGLNSVAVHYGYSEPAFQGAGDDLAVRIIWHN